MLGSGKQVKEIIVEDEGDSETEEEIVEIIVDQSKGKKGNLVTQDDTLDKKLIEKVGLGGKGGISSGQKIVSEIIEKGNL